MIRSRVADAVLASTVALGLVYTPAFAGIVFALLVKGKANKLNFDIGHYFIIAGALWAVLVITVRGIGGLESGLLLQYLYLWFLPIFLRLYGPTDYTIGCFKALIMALFSLDFLFNIYSLITGGDLLDRVTDVRGGLGESRKGGLFGHSFYSVTISSIAYVFMFSNKKYRLLSLLAILNLYLAGSFRAIVPIVLVPVFYIGWRARARVTELTSVIALSLAAVFSVFATSSIGDFGLPANPSNDLRIFAWTTAITKISNSPLFGVGYPTSDIDGIDESVVDESLIAESWYLTSAVTFGLPYLLLRLIGLICVLYGPRYSKRSVYEAVFVPLMLVELVYGAAFEGMLYYFIIWLVLESRRSGSGRIVREG